MIHISTFDIMIIDDDANVINRLKTIIDWDQLPIRLVCEAADSETAKELYLVYRPKIIITDIMIPIISGLELAKELLCENADLQFIVITGYNDFDMVKQSLELNAVSLLGKPVSKEEINSSIKKAIANLEQQHRERASRSALQEIITNNLPEMQKIFLSGLLRKQPENESLIPLKLQQLQLSLPGPNYIVSIISLQIPNRNSSNEELYPLLLPEMLSAELHNIQGVLHAYTDSHMRLICIISTPAANPDDYVEEVIVRIGESLHVSHEITIHAGIGSTVSSLSDLHLSYKGALSALNYQCLLGNDSVTHFKNLQRLDTPLTLQAPVYGHLRKLFRLGDLEAISHTIQKQLSFLTSNPHDSTAQIRQFFFEYLTAIMNEALCMGLDLEKTENFAVQIMQLFTTTSEWDRCMHNVLELTDSLYKRIQYQKANNTNHLVDMAKAYVMENLANKDLDLEQVSDHVGLSRIYFCKLFHQVEGVTFNTYLRDARLDLAKKLLITTNMKIFEISEAVGFSNAKYFSFAFKQAMGQTPVEYRDKN